MPSPRKFLLVFALATGLAAPAGFGTTYYVDSSGGSDSNGGTAPTSAWKTLTKASAPTFAAGDRLLLKRGGIWTGQLALKGAGVSGNPIVVDAYDTGNAPLLTGTDATVADQKGVVDLSNGQYWTIQNLEISYPGGSQQYHSGIMVRSDAGALCSGITIKNNYVHDVASYVLTRANIDPHLFGGISFRAVGPNDSFANVLIDGNTVTRCDRVGVVFWDSSFQPKSSASTGVVISNNAVTYSGGDSILLFGAANGLIDHNIGAFASNNSTLQSTTQYSAGIWPTRSYDATVQYNESYGTQLSGDGQGYDADVLLQGALFQYNYSHNNYGGGIMMMHDTAFKDPNQNPYDPNDHGTGLPPDVWDVTVRDSIFQNENGLGVFTFPQFETPARVKIYNNTVYQNANATAAIISNNTAPTYTETGKTDVEFRNNVIYKMNSVDWYPPSIGTKYAAGTYQYNLIYGIHTPHEPPDAYKLTTDPLLVSPGSGGNGIATVGGYKLRTGSPALTSGVLITESYAPHSVNGGKDYFGNNVSSTGAPSRGVYNGPAVNVTGATGGDALYDPGFETGSLGLWVDLGSASVATGNAHAGTHCAQIGTQYSGIRRNVTGLLPNTTYTLKAYVKNTVADATFLGVMNYGGVEKNTSTTSLNYTLLSITFTTGSGITSADIYIWKNGGSGLSYADDFSLASFVENSGFETGALLPWNNTNASTIVTGHAYSGTYCARIDASYSGIDMNVSGLTPNTSYTLTGYIQGSTGDAACLGVKNYGGIETNVNTTSTAYTKLSVTFITGSANTTANIYVWKNAGSGYTYVDQFALTKN